MIKRQMQNCKLYVADVTFDDYGDGEDNWKLVSNIYISLNYRKTDTHNGDIRYKDCNYIGLADYNYFLKGKKYRIQTKSDELYSIESINPITRMVQLLLKEVL